MRPAAATASFQGSPVLNLLDTDRDGKNDAVEVTQWVRVTRTTAPFNISLAANLFAPGVDPNTSWSSSVDTATTVQNDVSCGSNAGCSFPFSMTLQSHSAGPVGNYTIVLNLTLPAPTTNSISGPNATWARVYLEPRWTAGPGASGTDPAIVVGMGAASLAVAAAAVWWLQRRPEKPEIRTGKGYILETFQRDQALRTMEPFVNRGYATLVVSRLHPDEIRSMLPSPAVQPLWLVDHSDEAPKKVDTVTPSLEKLFARTSAFLEGSLRTAVVLDGLEFLIDNSNFSSVMRFLRRIIDIVAQRDSLFLVIVAPNALGPKERSNLERELTRIPV